ncbi:MAG TPA: ABC transporter permease subunit [Verrucomicrobiae bacterium]|nr:ABC transporter permease subunit [Verrucomicrobiae bacterium]
MNEQSPAQRTDAYYKFMEFSRASWIYALLIGGAAIFAWPFLWMVTTSVKMEREMFGEKIHLWPQRPIPQEQSPYVDTRSFDDVEGARMDEVLPALEEHLRTMNYPWPKELDKEATLKQVARGAFKKLLYTMPVDLWKLPHDELVAEVTKRVDAGTVQEMIGQIRRALLLGQLRARSYDLHEDQLVAAESAATAWQVSGTGKAELLQVDDPRDPHAEVRYDFSNGDTVLLSRTFTTSFSLKRDSVNHPTNGLYRLQLYLRNDDTWHQLTMYVEKLGMKYKADRTYPLSDFTNWGIATWQERGPDDLTNKRRDWMLLEEVDSGPQYESDPHKIKVTLELKKATALGAWEEKIHRNYGRALEYIPFWRYIATSTFLVVLNLIGTLFSCSIVAYSFARLQWPGRNFSFALMLATMMVPPQVTMIPYFLIIRSLGWYNTLYPLWVGSLFAGAFNVFLLRQFLKGIPRDLEDAAKIDGCGFWRVYWHIMLPLVKPTLAAIAIFTFMGVWNDFMGPLIYLTDQRLYPLSLGLFALNVETTSSLGASSMGIMMAGSLLMTLPVIIIFFFAQKYFIQGVTLTGMKG